VPHGSSRRNDIDATLDIGSTPSRRRSSPRSRAVYGGDEIAGKIDVRDVLPVANPKSAQFVAFPQPP